jgi:hypothetical protein
MALPTFLSAALDSLFLAGFFSVAGEVFLPLTLSFLDSSTLP